MQKPPMSWQAVAGVSTKNEPSLAPANVSSSRNLTDTMPSTKEMLAWSLT